jgi:predicted RNase H-like HicB family nuclease
VDGSEARKGRRLSKACRDQTRISAAVPSPHSSYHVVFTPDPETTTVVAEIPALQLADFGADVPEALERLQAMASFHLDCLVQEGNGLNQNVSS